MTFPLSHNNAEIESLLADLPTYSERTHNISVKVKTYWLDAEDDKLFTWLYHIRITNYNMKLYQILKRVWFLIDANGKEETIEGIGIIGEQPILLPYESFEYSSGTEFQTPSGMMRGYYIMQAFNPQTQKRTGKKIHVTIPAFSLDIPSHKATLH